MDSGDTCGSVVCHDIYSYLASADSSELDLAHHAFGNDGNCVHRFQSSDAEKIKVIHFFSSVRIVIHAECAIMGKVENYFRNNLYFELSLFKLCLSYFISSLT